jgi:hypothetical protein
MSRGRPRDRSRFTETTQTIFRNATPLSQNCGRFTRFTGGFGRFWGASSLIRLRPSPKWEPIPNPGITRQVCTRIMAGMADTRAMNCRPACSAASDLILERYRFIVIAAAECLAESDLTHQRQGANLRCGPFSSSFAAVVDKHRAPGKSGGGGQHKDAGSGPHIQGELRRGYRTASRSQPLPPPFVGS